MNKQIEFDQDFIRVISKEVLEYQARNGASVLRNEMRIYVPNIVEHYLIQMFGFTALDPLHSRIVGVPIVEGYEMAVVICAPSRFNAEIVKLEILRKD